MQKSLFFVIEKEKIYLEHVLVDYMDIPIFFLCKSDYHYYIALCTDLGESIYIVSKVSMLDIYALLHQKLPMRDIIINQKEYWEIVSGEDVNTDTVQKYPIRELDRNCLPEEGAYFQVLTDEMAAYVREYDKNFFQSEKFEKKKDEFDYSEDIKDYGETVHIRCENYDRVIEYTVKGSLAHKNILTEIAYDPVIATENKTSKWKIQKQSVLYDEDYIAA